MVGVAVHDAVCMVGPRLGLQDFRQPLAFGVGVVPEVEEEEEEDEAVQTNDVDEDGELVGAVAHEEVLRDVRGHHDKLDLRKRKTVSHMTRRCSLHLLEQRVKCNVPAEWWSGISSTTGTSGSWGPGRSGRSKST